MLEQRLRPLLLAAAGLAAGCGGSPSAAPPAGGVDTSPARPPEITLVSKAGRQPGVQGSSCVTLKDSSGGGTARCGDTGYPAPLQASVVRPGELLQVDVPGAQTMEAEIHRLGCHQDVVARLDLGPSGGWEVNLDPGLYELLVTVERFELGSAEGDTSGGLGLWVSRDRPLAVVSAKSLHAPGC